MSMPNYTIDLSEHESIQLQKTAKAEGVSIDQLIKRAILSLLRHKRNDLDLKKHSSFGMWADVDKTDEELLNELGGHWSNFPLKDV